MTALWRRTGDGGWRYGAPGPCRCFGVALGVEDVWENRSATFAGPKLTLPVAVTVFPRDIPRLPRSWIEDTYSNLIHYAAADQGGHFAALEQPEILVGEIRTGLRTLRS